MSIVLVFGTSGCGKRGLLRSLAELNPPVAALDLEEQWEKLNGQPFSYLLARPPEDRRTALTTTIDQLPLDSERRILIGVHAAHMVETMLSSSLPIDRFSDLGIAYCVTLHDDLYAVAKRLRDKGWPLTYQQILHWRSAELLVADLVSGLVCGKQPLLGDPPNFWLGAKHPMPVLLRLLHEPDSRKVYAAFSISGVLGLENGQTRDRLKDEITTYRRNLYDRGLIVFDPATLDDRLLINKVINDRVPRDEEILIEGSERWPYRVGPEDCYRPAVEDPDEMFPIRLSHTEAFLLKGPASLPHHPYDDVDAHITQIDLRYVRQADFVTVWRPFNQGVPSVGCYSEASSAVAQGKNVIAYSPDEDQQKYMRNPANQNRPLKHVWPAAVPLIPEEEDFWDKVDKVV